MSYLNLKMQADRAIALSIERSLVQHWRCELNRVVRRAGGWLVREY